MTPHEQSQRELAYKILPRSGKYHPETCTLLFLNFRKSKGTQKFFFIFLHNLPCFFHIFRIFLHISSPSHFYIHIGVEQLQIFPSPTARVCQQKGERWGRGLEKSDFRGSSYFAHMDIFHVVSELHSLFLNSRSLLKIRKYTPPPLLRKCP